MAPVGSVFKVEHVTQWQMPWASQYLLPLNRLGQPGFPSDSPEAAQGIGRDIQGSHLHCVKRVHRGKEENLRTSVLAPTLEDAQGRICLAMLHRRVFIRYRDVL